jgi:hypothetical protein
VLWALARGLGFVELRVDVVTVLLDGRRPSVEHLEGVV